MIGHSELLADRAAVPPVRSAQEGFAASAVGGSHGTVDADLIKSRDLISLVRALPERLRVFLAELPGDRLDAGRGCERPAPGTLSAIERVIGVGDLVRATADHLERLESDARPVHVRCYLSEPLAGYHRWAASTSSPCWRPNLNASPARPSGCRSMNRSPPTCARE